MQTLEVPGNALDVAIVPSGESSEKRLAVGFDADEAATPRLAVFQLGGEQWEPSGLAYQDTDVSAIDFTRAELDNVLYAVENLRKTENPWGDDDAADTPAADSEGPSSAAN